MKIFKRLAVKALSAAIAAVTALSVGLNASAAVISYKWSVDCSAPRQSDRIGWNYGGGNNFSVDRTVHTDSSDFSIKLENTNYNISYVERTYNVLPKTMYKFSAMVKYEGYQLDPDAEKKTSGACVGEAYSYNNSGYTTSNGWTLMEYKFTTGDETTINLALQNGIYNANCKGTAWFCDAKLEKAELTNNWDILAVFFRNSNATVSLNGKTVHHTMSLRTSDINDINKLTLDKLPQTLKAISNGKVTVNSIDRYYIDEALTEKDLEVYEYKDDNMTIPDSYCTDYDNSALIQRVLNNYLSQKNYNQILLYVPLEGINGNWWGLGGTKYNGINIAQITNSWEGAFQKGEEYNGNTTVHEICHGLQNDSKAINNDRTVHYHDLYNYPDMKEYDYQVRYMNDNLPDGKKGVEPSVFFRPNGKYMLLDNDMSTGKGIALSSDVLTAPANFRARSVSDTHIEFTWEQAANADGYQFINFRDPDHKEVWVSADYSANTVSSKWGPYTKGNTYYFGIRAVYTQNGSTAYSDWVYLSFTHTGTDVLYGDIDGNGKFNMADLTLIIQMYANRETLDQRTLAAAGISGRTTLVMTDLTTLITYYANNR